MALTPSRAARPRVLRASTFVSLAHAQMHSETHCQTVLQDRGISTAIASAPMLLEIALLRTCRAPCWPTCNTAAMPDRKAVSRQHCCVRRLRPPPGAAAAAGPIGTRSARSANSLCIVRDQLPKRFCFFQAPIHPSALGKALKLHKLSLCRLQIIISARSFVNRPQLCPL